MGLIPFRLEAWEPFLFVNCDTQAPSLAAFLESIPEEAKGLHLTGMKLAERREYTVQCNWKVYVDNYLEGYHIPIAHPGLMKEVDYAQYRVETRRYSSRQYAPIRAAGNDASRAYGKPGQQDAALYYWVFPNLMLNLYPDNLQVNVVVPLSQERTLTLFEWYCHQPESPVMKEKLAKAVAFSHQVQLEDIGLCEAVQRGLRSATYERGRYSPRRENGVHHFHSLLLEFLRE
jgi:choline monooxygenase